MRLDELKALVGECEIEEVAVGWVAPNVPHCGRTVMCLDWTDDGPKAYTSINEEVPNPTTVMDIYNILPVRVATVIDNSHNEEYDAYDDAEVDGIWYYKNTLYIHIKEN